MDTSITDPRLHRMFGRARLQDRQVNELVGLAQGLTLDGKVNQEEAEFLQKWLAANQGVCDNPVIGRLSERVDQMLRDKHLDSEEAQELFDVLKKFSGGDVELGEVVKASALPLCDPPPSLVFPDKSFTFTGIFAFGSRNACEAAIFERGGKAGPITKKTDYLVIGIYATESWIHSTYGRKIEKAMAMRAKGVPISIVSEKHWFDFL